MVRLTFVSVELLNKVIELFTEFLFLVKYGSHSLFFKPKKIMKVKVVPTVAKALKYTHTQIEKAH